MNQRPFHQSTHLPSLDKQVFTVRSTSYKAVGWVCTTFFLFCAVASYLAGQADATPCFLLLMPLGILMILIAGELTMSSDDITYKTPLGQYRLRWDEVKKVEMDEQGYAIVFYASDRNRRIAVLGPRYWSGTDKQNLARLLANEMEKRQIELEKTPRAASVLMSKNTQVK